MDQINSALQSKINFLKNKLKFHLGLLAYVQNLNYYVNMQERRLPDFIQQDFLSKMWVAINEPSCKIHFRKPCYYWKVHKIIAPLFYVKLVNYKQVFSFKTFRNWIWSKQKVFFIVYTELRKN